MNRINRLSLNLTWNLAWTLGACGLLWLSSAGSSFAGTNAVPELDPGSAVGGIALVITAAVLLVERHRRRG
jgi:hypothetical protein